MLKNIIIPIAGRKYRVSIWGVLVYMVLLGILCSLGSWQLRRADEKKQFMQKQLLAGKAELIELNQYDGIALTHLEYKQVSVSGHYDQSHQFLIDNQINKGQVGYFVMTPFFIAGHHQAVLVNRGWVPMNKDRLIKPDIDFDKVETVLTGRVNHFPVVGIKLAGADIPSDTWPGVVQIVNTEILAAKLGYPLVDFQIELDAEMPQGYDRDWKKRVIMPPEKHVAYALQWFALAITLTVLFVWYTFKNNESSTEKKS